MPRFVVLLHETPPDYPRGTHFDWMFEFGDTLRTWAMDKLPSTGETAIAEQLPNHRLAYLDYEGQLSGDRGCVKRIATGEFDFLEETATRIVVGLCAPQWDGTLTLTIDDSDPHRWRVAFAPP